MAGQPHEAAAAAAVSAPAQAARAGLRGNILLVEDNLINQQVALGILQLQGYNVTVVSNGREALDAHARCAFDLILMDCHMPEVDGFEATREIRERERVSAGKPIPIVALTANAMAHDRDECLSAGMDDHLSKPFSMQTLQDMLDRWMPEAAAEREPAGAALPSFSQPLDRQVLEQLGKVVTRGKPELLARVVKLYLAESPKLVHRLKAAAGSKDAKEIARIAHSLKSSSANVGAAALSRFCEEMERSARSAARHEMQELLERIELEHDCVQTALAAECELLAPAA
jgi:CheY-like chemotaxis protein/HPt (histidine-containing phosphotransfer) domain-containing protein